MLCLCKDMWDKSEPPEGKTEHLEMTFWYFLKVGGGGRLVEIQFL